MWSFSANGGVRDSNSNIGEDMGRIHCNTTHNFQILGDNDIQLGNNFSQSATEKKIVDFGKRSISIACVLNVGYVENTGPRE